MGLHISVYANPLGDCTNYGISGGGRQSLTVVNVVGPFEPSDDSPAVMLKLRDVGFSKFPIIVPIIDGKEQEGMFGGNFAFTSDSRFSRAVRDLLGGSEIAVGAIKIFDRFE